MLAKLVLTGNDGRFPVVLVSNRACLDMSRKCDGRPSDGQEAEDRDGEENLHTARKG